MLDNLFYILNTVREEILEGFIIPQLGLSYWEFLCLLAIVGIVITVLVNSVRVSGSAAVNQSKRNSFKRKEGND